MANYIYRLLPYLYVSLIFSFIGGQLARISIYNQQVNGYIYEFFLILNLILFFFLYKSRPLKVAFRKIPILFAFLLYLLATLVLTTVNFTFFQNAVALLYLARLVLYTVFPLYFYFYLQDKKTDLSFIKNTTVICFALFIVICFVQYLFLPDLRPIDYLGWDEHLYRMFGTFLEPVIVGSLLGMLWFFMLCRKNLHRLIRYGILVVLGLGILLTFSRTVYVGWIVTFVLYFILYRKWKVLVAFLLLVTLLIFLIPKPFGEGVNLLRNSTINARLNDYQQGLSLWKTHPFIGIGYNHIGAVKEKDSTHFIATHGRTAFQSSFLTILVASGILGIVLFIGVLIAIARLNFFSALTILFLSIVSLADNVLLHPFIIISCGWLICFSLVNLFDT